jgi:mediator of RNA polymerase II transcription subunit 7
MGEGVPITNTLFPPPPAYYKAFTPEAVARYAELRAGDGAAAGAGVGASSGGDAMDEDGVTSSPIAPAEPGELERLEHELEPPRTDWVREEGRWMLFGQMYTVCAECAEQMCVDGELTMQTEPHIANARDIGLAPLVADPVSSGGDAERETLPTLLHSFLHTLLAFIDILTTPARNPEELQVAQRESEGDQVCVAPAIL